MDCLALLSEKLQVECLNNVFEIPTSIHKLVWADIKYTDIDYTSDDVLGEDIT
jgi:hypothetical protein